MSNREELATMIANHHDKFFGVEYAEPATQDFGLADELIAAGYGLLPVEPVAWHHTPEPEGVQVVNDDTDNEGEDQNRWARTNNGTGWKGYKNGGSVYLEWEELERRWGPITW